MSEHPWTPGPWEWRGVKDLQQVPTHGGNYGALIWMPNEDVPHVLTVNAELIALCPEMAEAIIKAKQELDWHHEDHPREVQHAREILMSMTKKLRGIGNE